MSLTKEKGFALRIASSTFTSRNKSLLTEPISDAKCVHERARTHTLNLGVGGIFHLKNCKNTKYIIKFITAVRKEKRRLALGEDERIEI